MQYGLHTRQQLFLAVSQLPVVRSEHVRTLFDNTQSQESKSEVCAHKFYTAMYIKTHLDNALFLSSMWSDLSCAGELVIAGSPAGSPLQTWARLSTECDVDMDSVTLCLW